MLSSCLTSTYFISLATLRDQWTILDVLCATYIYYCIIISFYIEKVTCHETSVIY